MGNIAAAAGPVPSDTHVATFVLPIWVTLLGAGVPVFAGVPTFHPTILIWTVADDLTLSIGSVGGTVLGALAIARL